MERLAFMEFKDEDGDEVIVKLNDVQSISYHDRDGGMVMLNDANGDTIAYVKGDVHEIFRRLAKKFK